MRSFALSGGGKNRNPPVSSDELLRKVLLLQNGGKIWNMLF
jgi:hypothetical protein